MIIKLQLTTFFVIVFLFLSFVSTPEAARKTEWMDGIVTKEPHKIDDNIYIQVNGRLYKILPDISIVYHYERSEGAFNEKNAQLFAIRKNQKISILIRHFEVIQIILH